jgi:hypothetical protein
MSDFQAIGSVSASLKALLEDRMETPPGVTDFEVTVSAPRSESENGEVERARINLFLYRIAENSFLKNQEIPGHGHPAAFGHPPLSLNLYYMLTPYGSTADDDFVNETVSHLLLGSAMRVLHEIPVLTDQLTTVRTPVGQPILSESLRNEFEQVKLTFDPVSLDDLSKVWTALTLPYRLSAAYMVSVVQIESRQLRTFPRPVGEPPPAGPRVFALPIRRPRITEIKVRRPADPPDVERPVAYASIGDTLVIKGINLRGDNTRVLLGAVDATPQVTLLRDQRIEVVIPDNAQLQPGPHTANVVMDVLLGDPLTPHLGLQSNFGVFVLVPLITGLVPNLGATPRTLIINGRRLFNSQLESQTLVGDELIPSANYTTSTPAQIGFDLPAALGTGNHAVRVRVNGVENVVDSILNIP